MDGGAYWAAVHGVAKSRTQLSDFTFTFHFHASEKEMATHSTVLAWRIPGMGEPGGLLSMGSHRVGHDWSDLAAAAGSSVPEILKARILEWVAVPFPRGSFWPRDGTQVSCFTGRFFTIWATREGLFRCGGDKKARQKEKPGICSHKGKGQSWELRCPGSWHFYSAGV